MLLAVLVSGRGGWVRRGEPETGPPPSNRIDARNPSRLDEALAEATSASWDLARETSAPAARIGRQLLGAAALPEPGAAWLPPVAVGPVRGVWKTVGDRIEAGVRPLSGVTRQAFGFLIDPATQPRSAAAPSPEGT
jgi:hypothetical protein